MNAAWDVAFHDHLGCRETLIDNMEATDSAIPETTAGLAEAAPVAVVDPVSIAVSTGPNPNPANASAQVSAEAAAPIIVTRDATGM